MAAKAPGKTDKKTAPGGAVPANRIVIGKMKKYEVLDLKFGNRSGLVRLHPAGIRGYWPVPAFAPFV